jgi:hypothetical protein
MTPKLLLQGLYTSLFIALVPLSAVPAQDSEREGGLTGTGIVGEITAIGDIIVNGQHIAVEADLRVSSALGPKEASELVPGDVIAATVALGETGWTATSITENHVLVGPVAHEGEGLFTVLGVPVTWSDPVTPGTWVVVSGFWTPDGIAATRVQTIDQQDTFSFQGSYRANSNGSPAMVGTLELDIDPLQHANEGDIIRVTGVLHGEDLIVTDVHHGLFDHPVALVLAEGYLTSVAPSGHYTVAGSGLSAYTDNHQSIMTTERITVCGLEGRLGLPDTRELGEQVERLGCLDYSQ